MVSFEEIDDYLKDVLNVKTKAEFEQRILNDKEFAEQVAFYLNFVRVARETNNETKKNRFKEIYHQSASAKPEAGIRKLWPYAAMMAAVVATLFVGIYLYSTSASSSAAIADSYIKNNFKQLAVQMGDDNDAFSKGKTLFNDSSNYQAALLKFEEVLTTDSTNTDAREFAGISALKSMQYDKALEYFKQLESDKNLTENHGKFYQALTLMKRNEAGDREIYTRLLTEIKRDNLFGKEEAEKYLEKL